MVDVIIILVGEIVMLVGVWVCNSMGVIVWVGEIVK
jgi:hypothetical protein